jgi:hypothetical protein
MKMSRQLKKKLGCIWKSLSNLGKSLRNLGKTPRCIWKNMGTNATYKPK